MAAQALTAPIPAPLAPAPQRRLPFRSLAPHLLVVANANASGLARRPELVDDSVRLLRSLGARAQAHVTATLDELADTLRSAERRVVLLGGDGSLHAAANVRGPKPELALLPAGRANNVASVLGVPTDLAAAARLAVEGAPRALDLIAAEAAGRRQLVVEGLSVGFHAQARAGYHGANSADLLAGVKTGLRALADYRPVTVGIERDGVSELLTVGQLFAANLPLYGFGLRVAPNADPADGLLDLVTLEAEHRRDVLAMIPHLRRGTHVGRRGVRVVSAQRVRIATGGGSPIIADTTTLNADTVDLTVERAALTVVGAAA